MNVVLREPLCRALARASPVLENDVQEPETRSRLELTVPAVDHGCRAVM